ncbi:MAG: hypothetical protein QOG50_822 [Actinomycetota bacterium]|jgi:hypothetical protein|nr:hypothetical protein [Actinomycetota bacterium]
MSELDVWTVSIMLRSEDGQTRADAFLQGPEVEVECSGRSGRTPTPPSTAANGSDRAAARALQDLSRCLTERAGLDGARAERTDDGT